MNPDPIIGRVLFTDGIVRPVFRDDGGSQYVIDRDGHTRRYGAWRPGHDDNSSDAPLSYTLRLRTPRAGIRGSVVSLFRLGPRTRPT